MKEAHLVTGDNLHEAYDPAVGIRYEVAEGCIRTMLKPLYGRERKASELMGKERIEEASISSPSYSPTIRLQVLEIITDGDPIEDIADEIDMRVVGRAVADFFTFRVATVGKRKTSLV